MKKVRRGFSAFFSAFVCLLWNKSATWKIQEWLIPCCICALGESTWRLMAPFSLVTQRLLSFARDVFTVVRGVSVSWEDSTAQQNLFK